MRGAQNGLQIKVSTLDVAAGLVGSLGRFGAFGALFQRAVLAMMAKLVWLGCESSRPRCGLCVRIFQLRWLQAVEAIEHCF